MQIYPQAEEFCRLAEQYKVIPVLAEFPADLETPISVYLKLVAEAPGYLLESAESGRNFGRYSFIGFKPLAEVISNSKATELLIDGKKKTVSGNPLEILENFMAEFSVADTGQSLPFGGGAVGYFAYDLIAAFERVRGYRLPADLELARLLFCQIIVIFDHLQHLLKLVYLARPACCRDASGAYTEAVSALSDLHNKLVSNIPAILSDKACQGEREPFCLPADDSPVAMHYKAMVKKAKEYIAAGDAFQIVLSHEFRSSVRRHPFNLYRRLRQVNPSPYMFYLNYGDKQLVGASPEMLVKLNKGKVMTCPIAGTRPRGIDSEADERLAAELLADEKERAEHAMLVDLGRNDIGRISLPGSVTVERYMDVEKFSHVMHLVSLVSGTLDPDYSAIDALKACFPAGTVSGAPKVRAMEIIHELEGDCRRAYAGAVGYIDFNGNMDTCITIRTMSVEGGEAIIRTGAGIVHDSDPAKEFQEVLHKGKALFKLMEGDE